MNEQETIRRIQSSEYTSTSVAYHFLQPEIALSELSDGSTIARMGYQNGRESLMGDPVTPQKGLDQFALALSEEFPAASVFHIEKRTATALQRQHFKIHSMGIESRVGLPFSLSARDKSDLRRALNRSERAGVAVRELTESEYAIYDTRIITQNRNWLQQRKYFKREFRFLARPYVARYQTGERRFVAFQNDQPIGIAVYDPVFHQGTIVGYFESIVRCFDTTAGVRDHLTLTALKTFTLDRKSAKWVSLGLSPFAPLPGQDINQARTSLTQLALALFYRKGHRVFNCHGLAFHKARYRGKSIPIYFATKSRFPLIALYRACRLSNIDPLQIVFSSILGFKGFRRYFPAFYKKKLPA